MHPADDLLDPLLLNLEYEVETVAHLVAHDLGDPPHRRLGWRRLGAWRSCLLAHRQAEARQEQLALLRVRIGKKARYHARRHRPQSLDDGAGFFQPSHMRVTRRESAITLGQAGKFVRRQGKQLRGLIETPTEEVSQADVKPRGSKISAWVEPQRHCQLLDRGIVLAGLNSEHTADIPTAGVARVERNATVD